MLNKQLSGLLVDQLLHLLRFRNQDFQEVTIELPGLPALRFATAYGFRNIQNIVPKVKRGKLPYDFVEVMACPSGSHTIWITHTHTPFYGPLDFVRDNPVSWYQTSKTNLDLLEQKIVSGSGISLAICKSAPHCRQVTMPAPDH